MVMITHWLITERRALERMYAEGVTVVDIARELNRTEDAIRRAVGRWKLHRAPEHRSVDLRANRAWPRIQAALRQRAMTIQQLIEFTGMFKSVIVRNLGEHRGQMHVAGWVSTSRRPAAIWALGSGPDAAKPIRSYRVRRAAANPFLTAAGLIAAPSGQKGRIIAQE